MKISFNILDFLARTHTLTKPIVYVDFGLPPPFSGWGFDPANTRYVNSRTSGLSAGNIAGLRLKWAFGVDGAFLARRFLRPARAPLLLSARTYICMPALVGMRVTKSRG